MIRKIRYIWETRTPDPYLAAAIKIGGTGVLISSLPGLLPSVPSVLLLSWRGQLRSSYGVAALSPAKAELTWEDDHGGASFRPGSLERRLLHQCG